MKNFISWQYILNLLREDNLYIKDKMPGHNVSYIWRFTVILPLAWLLAVLYVQIAILLYHSSLHYRYNYCIDNNNSNSSCYYCCCCCYQFEDTRAETYSIWSKGKSRTRWTVSYNYYTTCTCTLIYKHWQKLCMPLYQDSLIKEMSSFDVSSPRDTYSNRSLSLHIPLRWGRGTSPLHLHAWFHYCLLIFSLGLF